ncbi:WD40 repeat domain-containing protein [Pyxidicoccus sp. 3LG]
MSRPVFVLLLVGLCVLGCGRARKKYLAQLEADWAELEKGALATPDPEDDSPALVEFLTRYPETHEYGNPRADKARELMNRAYWEKARLREAAELQSKVAPLAASFLFRRAVDASPGQFYRDPEPLHVIALRHEGLRLLTRGREESSLGYLVRAAPLAELRELVGSAIYDEEEHRYDGEELGRLLAAAYVPPDAPLLGQASREVYKLFRPFVRFQARLYRVLVQQQEAIREYERALQQGEAHLPKLDWNSEERWDEGELRFANYDSHNYFDEPAKDRRHFYRAVTLELGLDAKAGLERRKFDYLDVGFWLRRFEDGTADTLGNFLLHVLEGHDPDFKKELETLEGKWPPPTSSGEPPRVPLHEGPLEAERLVAFDPPWMAAVFNEDGETLTVVTNRDVRRISREDGQVLMGKAYREQPPAPGLWEQDVAAFSPDGSVIALAAHGLPRPLLLDARTGEPLEPLEELSRVEAFHFNRAATLLAAQLGYSNVAVLALGEAPVAQQEGPDAGQAPGRTRLRTFHDAGRLVGLHPDLPLLLTRSSEYLLVWDLETGKLRRKLRVEEPLSGAALAPDGVTLLLSYEEHLRQLSFDAKEVELSLGGISMMGLSFTEAVFTRNGRFAILRDLDGTTRVLDVVKGARRPEGFSGGRVLAISPDADLLLQKSSGEPGELLLYAPLVSRSFPGEFKDARAMRALHGTFDAKKGGSPWVPAPEEAGLEALKPFASDRLLARPWKTVFYSVRGQAKALLLTETRSETGGSSATALIGGAVFSATAEGWKVEKVQRVITGIDASSVEKGSSITVHEIARQGFLAGLTTGSGELVLLSDVPWSAKREPIMEVGRITGVEMGTDGGDVPWVLDTTSGREMPELLLGERRFRFESPAYQLVR